MLHTCPKDKAMVDCLHPDSGTIYGPTAGKAIYHISPAIRSDLATGHSNPNTASSTIPPALQSRFSHTYYLDCGDRDRTRYCSNSPYGYWCDKHGYMHKREYVWGCGEHCNCWKFGEQSNCITFHGYCWVLWGNPENLIKKQSEGQAEGKEVEEVKAKEGTT